MVNNAEHGYMPLPNYLAKTLASVARFHDPHDPQGQQYRSRSNSAENLADVLKSSVLSNSKSTEFFPDGTSTSPSSPRQKMNTVNMIPQEGPTANQKLSLQLPSLITPVSLYGKRIRSANTAYFCPTVRARSRLLMLTPLDTRYWNMNHCWILVT